MEGTKIGSYRLTRKLGEGGMGAVYLAESESLSTRKAVKVLLAELSVDPAMMTRFRTEAQAVADLQHDNIIGIDEFSQLPNGQWFIMMPFLEGASLGGFLMSRGPLGIHLTLHILAQVGAALHTAHAAGFVHRDLKPENIFITSRHSNPHLVKLLDFGIAKNTRSSPNGQRTASGTVLGTPGFMAAEQYEDAARVDARADLFSLGVIAYVLLSGHYPFGPPTENWMALYNRQRTEAPEPLPSHVPTRVQQAIYRALAYNPGARPQSAQEFIIELALGTPDDPMEPTGIEIVRLVASELLLTGPATETTRSPHAAELARALWPRLGGSTPTPASSAEAPSRATVDGYAGSGRPATPPYPQSLASARASTPVAPSSGVPHTTLSAASGAVPVAQTPAGPPRRRGPLVAAASILGAGAVGVVLIVTRSPARPSEPAPAMEAPHGAVAAADAATSIGDRAADSVPATPAAAVAPTKPPPTAAATAVERTRSISIETIPSGADLLIDGHSPGRSPITIERRVGSKVVVRAERSGYRTKTESFTVGETTTEIDLRLTPKSSRPSTASDSEPTRPAKPDAAPRRESFNPDDVVGK